MRSCTTSDRWNEPLLTRSPAKWPASTAFDEIANALSDPAAKKDAIKQGASIFGFTIKNASGEEKSWYVDLKETGTVGAGTAPEGKKADGTWSTLGPEYWHHATSGPNTLLDCEDADPGIVTLILSEDNFGKLIDQKANAQKLFMSGKLKVKGNVMKATKLEPILKKARPQSKL